MLVPLGLLAWIAFSFPLIMINGAYVISVVSDPFGWGSNLVGTAHVPWTPVLPEYTGFIQAPLLLIGLGFALKRGREIAGQLYVDDSQATRSLIPAAIVCVGFTLVFLRLFLG